MIKARLLFALTMFAVFLVDSNGIAHPATSFQTTVRGGSTTTSLQLGPNAPARADNGQIELRSPAGVLSRYQFSGGTLLNGNLRILKLNVR